MEHYGILPSGANTYFGPTRHSLSTQFAPIFAPLETMQFSSIEPGPTSTLSITTVLTSLALSPNSQFCPTIELWSLAVPVGLLSRPGGSSSNAFLSQSVYMNQNVRIFILSTPSNQLQLNISFTMDSPIY